MLISGKKWYKMSCFTGEYNNTMDDKGRIALPAKIRSSITGDIIWITKGMGNDRSLLIYAPDEWARTVENLSSRLSVYNENTRWLYRRFVSPAQEVTIDKNGRIAIPLSLREFAGLKKECVFLGMNTIVELWDQGIYSEEINKITNSDINLFEGLGNL